MSIIAPTLLYTACFLVVMANAAYLAAAAASRPEITRATARAAYHLCLAAAVLATLGLFTAVLV